MLKRIFFLVYEMLWLLNSVSRLENLTGELNFFAIRHIYIYLFQCLNKNLLGFISISSHHNIESWVTLFTYFFRSVVCCFLAWGLLSFLRHHHLCMEWVRIYLMRDRGGEFILLSLQWCKENYENEYLSQCSSPSKCILLLRYVCTLSHIFTMSYEMTQRPQGLE